MQKRKHVLLVSRPVCPPWDEGSKNALRLLALNMHTHVMHVLTATSVFPCLDSEPNVVVERVYSQSGIINGSTYSRLTVLARLQLLLRLIRNSPPVDIYHSYFVPTAATSVTLRALASKVRVRTVQTIASLPNSAMSDGAIRRLAFADVVVALSRWTEQRLRCAGISAVVRICPPVDVRRYSPEAVGITNRVSLMQGLDKKLVLYVGEYTRLGSLPILSNAISHVCRAVRHIDFVVPGRIKSKPDLASKEAFVRFLQENGLTNRVRIPGTVEDMPSLIGACDLAVFPATEMMGKFDIPMSLAECLAMGKPLIVSDIPPLSEIVEDGVGVVTSADDDGSELAEMILSLLGDTPRLSRMGETARKLAIARYDARKVAQQYADIYSQL